MVLGAKRSTQQSCLARSQISKRAQHHHHVLDRAESDIIYTLTVGLQEQLL